MKKRMVVMIICLVILFGGIFGWKVFVSHKRASIAKMRLAARLATITAMEAKETPWQKTIEASGSTRTYKGVYVTTELGAMVTSINFTPGQKVKQGQLLVQLDISADVAQLHALEAQAAYAKITYERNLRQYRIGAISQETLASNLADEESTAADVQKQIATIAMKTVRAPFSGRLGISMVNLGQYINPGDKIVSLETLTPIYTDFFLPQQDLPDVKVGVPVAVTVDTFPNRIFSGVITTVNPLVDKDVRNVEVEATIPNEDETLLPGMYTTVKINVGNPKKLITLPMTAVSFNPYGNVAFTLTKTTETRNGKPIWIAKQIFVNTGEVRGDQIAILSGIKPGDMVVTSGQLKLQNGSRVLVDNSVQPEDSANPKVNESDD